MVGESCIMLESGPTCSLIAKLSQHLLLVVCEFHSAGEQHSEQGYRQECANFDARCYGT